MQNNGDYIKAPGPDASAAIKLLAKISIENGSYDSAVKSPSIFYTSVRLSILRPPRTVASGAGGRAGFYCPSINSRRLSCYLRPTSPSRKGRGNTCAKEGVSATGNIAVNFLPSRPLPPDEFERNFSIASAENSGLRSPVKLEGNSQVLHGYTSRGLARFIGDFERDDKPEFQEGVRPRCSHPVAISIMLSEGSFLQICDDFMHAYLSTCAYLLK